MTSIMTFNQLGHKVWKNKKGEYHRENGPAVIWKNNRREWWVNGQRHRLEGPAIEWKDGSKSWYVNNEPHRIEGPAVEWGMYKKWWVGGKPITDLIWELLRKSPFGEDVHLGIMADYWAERGDFRLLDIIQPYLTESK